MLNSVQAIVANPSSIGIERLRFCFERVDQGRG
jgi:hypothetical protein